MNPPRIRLAFDARRKSTIGTVDVLTNGVASLPRGYAAKVECSLFDLNSLVDISNVSTLTLRCVSNDDVTGASAFTQVLGSLDLDLTATAQDWTNGHAAGTGQQATFDLTEANTSVAMGGLVEAYYHFLVTAILTDGKKYPWGWSKVRFIETGLAAVTSPDEGDDGYTAEQADLVFQQLKSEVLYVPVYDESTGLATGEVVPAKAISIGGGYYRLEPGNAETI